MVARKSKPPAAAAVAAAAAAAAATVKRQGSMSLPTGSAVTRVVKPSTASAIPSLVLLFLLCKNNV
jgi:hypothetical protein